MLPQVNWSADLKFRVPWWTMTLLNDWMNEVEVDIFHWKDVEVGTCIIVKNLKVRPISLENECYQMHPVFLVVCKVDGLEKTRIC